jgi:hypothetical protein
MEDIVVTMQHIISYLTRIASLLEDQTAEPCARGYSPPVLFTGARGRPKVVIT